MSSFNLRLNERITSLKSHLCVGLDIANSSFNNSNIELKKLKDHAKKVVESTRDLVVAYKPNFAFFEKWGSKGYQWLEEIVDFIGDDIIKIADAKRGDIGNTATQYAESIFGHFGFDAVTLSPYMGWDSIAPFVADEKKGAFILCKTSNASSKDFQNLPIENKKLFEIVAQRSSKWNASNNIGLVVGATASNEIRVVRKYAKNMPLLIPGVGAQGGDLKTSMIEGNTNGDAIINVSRGICFAGDLSSNAIRLKAEEYYKNMRELMDEQR